MIKKAAIILLSAALTIAALFALNHGERVTRQLVISILRSVPCLFLTTSRVEQLCVSHVDDSNWLWGTRQGMSRLNIRTYLGVDLQKLKPNAVRVDGQRVTIHLPEPEVLDVVPDLTSWKYVSKASGLQHMRDAVRGRSVRDELLALVQEALPRYRNATLYTDRASIADRLNREATNLFKPTGLSVKFE